MEENYSPEQIFNMDETTLFWKRMPERTFQPYDCIKNVPQALGDVTKEDMTGIWKKTLKRFVHDFKGLPRMRRLQKSARLWLRWQATLTWVWMRMTLRSF
jgi:hypothetical protein